MLSRLFKLNSRISDALKKNQNKKMDRFKSEAEANLKFFTIIYNKITS
jgi:hypothetical protein